MRQGPAFENEALAQAAPQCDRDHGKRRSVSTWVQLVLLGFQGVSGVIGGIGRYQPTPPLQLTYGAVGLILLYVGLRTATGPR